MDPNCLNIYMSHFLPFLWTKPMIYWKANFCVYQCLHFWQKFAKIDRPSIKLQICSSRTIGQTPFERFSIIQQLCCLSVCMDLLCLIMIWLRLPLVDCNFIYLGVNSYLAETNSSCGSQSTPTGTYRVFFYWSAQKTCQTLRKFWHFWWDLLCNLTLRSFRGGPVKKTTLYIY